MAESAAQSSWKPYIIGFLVGAAVLTVLPFLQRGFLKAPPPVMRLDAWEAASLQGEPTGSRALTGQVTLLMVEEAPCQAECVKRVGEFGSAAEHVTDLAGKVRILVGLMSPPASLDALQGLPKGAEVWVLSPPTANRQPLEVQLQAALEKFEGERRTDFLKSHAIVLIDQNHDVRGFWPPDEGGRGNSINAARLLARRGANP